MSQIENPPAFPSSATFEAGMTLRDYFAGQALTGMIACGRWVNSPEDYPHYAAGSAYALADAMLAERMKGSQS